MMRKATSAGLLLTLFAGCFVNAQEVQTSSPPSEARKALKTDDVELQAIRAGSKAFVEVFDAGDAAAIAGMWTTRGEYIDAEGEAFHGRDEIKRAYADFFIENDGATLTLEIDSLKMLGDSVASEQGTSIVRLPSGPSTGGSAIKGRYEAIHAKVDGKWQMASVRDEVVLPTLAEQNLLDLEFLIGSWVAEEHGIKTESVCKWVGDRRFVQRDYTTTRPDGKKSSGIQLIGWNSQAGHVQSWTFSSDGGHAVGAWMPTDDGWSAQMQGMTGDGAQTTAVNLLRRLDDDAYVWQSVDRTVGGVAVDDTNEVVIKRQP